MEVCAKHEPVGMMILFYLIFRWNYTLFNQNIFLF